MLTELLVKTPEGHEMTETPKIPNAQLLILWLLTNLSQIKMKTLRKDVELD